MLRGMIRRGGVTATVGVLGGLILSGGVANAGPFCYDTGPGYQKCISSPSGDYFTPIYAGPKLPDSYIPWTPSDSDLPSWSPDFSLPPADAPAPPPLVASSGPPVGSMCAHADMNTTAIASDTSAVRCEFVPSVGYEWLPDTGVNQIDPAVAGQNAWGDCIASHTAAECRQIVDGHS